MTQPRTKKSSLAAQLAAPGPVLVLWSARWAPAGEVLWRHLEAYLDDHPACPPSGGQRVRIDVAAEHGLAETFQIVTLPTVLVLVGGKERRRLTGAASPEDVVNAWHLRRRV